MPSGGARLRPGPAKDPNALRREHDKVEWTRLPSERVGETPSWPLSRQTLRERVVWEREWRRPQAVMWEQAKQWPEVAMYVRQFVRCEKPNASAADRRLLQSQMGDLGLTQSALAKFLWRIGDDSAQPTQRQLAPSDTSVKDRFRVLDGTG